MHQKISIILYPVRFYIVKTQITMKQKKINGNLYGTNVGMHLMSYVF